MAFSMVSAGISGHRFQGPGGIRAAQSGSSVEVDVGPNDSEITIVDTASGELSTYPVAPGKTTKIPLPSAPPGTAINVTIGRGRTARTVVFEIIGSPP